MRPTHVIVDRKAPEQVFPQHNPRCPPGRAEMRRQAASGRATDGRPQAASSCLVPASQGRFRQRRPWTRSCGRAAGPSVAGRSCPTVDRAAAAPAPESRRRPDRARRAARRPAPRRAADRRGSPGCNAMPCAMQRPTRGKGGGGGVGAAAPVPPTRMTASQAAVRAPRRSRSASRRPFRRRHRRAEACEVGDEGGRQ